VTHNIVIVHVSLNPEEPPVGDSCDVLVKLNRTRAARLDGRMLNVKI
jgi:hypothetical protein